MVFVAVMSCLALVQWIMRLCMRGDKVLYLYNHLRMLNRIEKGSDDRQQIEDFYDRYLRQDGIFLLRLIGHNTNNITVTDITAALYDRWMEYEQEMQADDDNSIDGAGAGAFKMEKLPETSKMDMA